MPSQFKHPFIISRLIIIILFLVLGCPVFGDDLLKEEAVRFHKKGQAAQKIGLWDEAYSFYQKSIQLDPSSALVFQDLGVVCEKLGYAALAEEAYLRAVAIDPRYAPGYQSLAALYEANGDFEKAAEYWIKLIEEPGQDKVKINLAKNRLLEIGEIIPEVKDRYRELEMASLIRELAALRQQRFSEQRSQSALYIERGDGLLQNKDYANALKMYLDAKQLDPQNEQIDSLLEEAQKRLLL